MLIKRYSTATLERIRLRFNRLYGPQRARPCLERLVTLIGRYGIGYEPDPAPPNRDEKTAVLITYADLLQREGEPPLQTLAHFARARLKNRFSTLHLLPFFPWSSDDGFSVIDYRQVNPACGSWGDIRELARDFELMFDLVLNHTSRKSTWFKQYTSGIAPYRDYFIEAAPEADLSAVVRPRSLPLLTVVTAHGEKKYLWTTFSDDQMDLNFANPDVLFEFLDILLFYIARGARILRLDAIAYLWKQPGTPCIHLEQTHETVKLLRDLLDMVAPGVMLLTETNVPHAENIAYLGDGDEAHMVYQFSLPPLLLHALRTGNSHPLTAWAETVCETPPGCTWFNFTASHDGIGLRPLTSLIPDTEINTLAEQMQTLGGQVSFKQNRDGTESPYELNITWFDALGGDEHQTARFLCSQTVLLGLKGIPALYFHSLTATPNDQEGFQATGRARSLNRKKWQADELETLLAGNSTAAQVFNELCRQLEIRRAQPAFHPDAAQRILQLDASAFGFIRTAADESRIICLHNFSAAPLTIKAGKALPELDDPGPLTDLLSGTRYSGKGKRIPLAPYQVVWLTPS